MPCSPGRADQCGAPDPGGAQLEGVGKRRGRERGRRSSRFSKSKETRGELWRAASGPITARNVPTFPLSPNDNASIRGLHGQRTYRRHLSSFHSSLGGITPALSHMQPITSAAETCRIYFAYKESMANCVIVLPSQALTLTHQSLLPIMSVGHDLQGTRLI
ncbi:hypothetical protein BO83DRAFT_403145 [Aspergillus eucalypticola CBS 122712]|uniref:Uncharacterized protein n=1 Tax=Aspergillus eucalypticola (strain CBS 122712 / IBT 29274) TaxID=1448314 RepID=A0A317UU17_ASPEC|nr:uncharacterized protein BO83DRAFT_403145 [Aspergillus eucalypticola CBS 122712]PWY63520.1 hypothetical protein BO83DRAFT_403145 [Aspergillus eucalypticola CBS 122712]